VWVSEEPLITKYPYFSYKYILLDDEKTTFVEWETGINRLCDCRLLSKTTQQAIMTKKRGVIETKMKYVSNEKEAALLGTQSISASDIKGAIQLETNDEWEKFFIKFSIIDGTS